MISNTNITTFICHDLDNNSFPIMLSKEVDIESIADEIWKKSGGRLTTPCGEGDYVFQSKDEFIKTLKSEIPE